MFFSNALPAVDLVFFFLFLYVWKHTKSKQFETTDKSSSLFYLFLSSFFFTSHFFLCFLSTSLSVGLCSLSNFFFLISFNTISSVFLSCSPVKMIEYNYPFFVENFFLKFLDTSNPHNHCIYIE